MSQIAFLNAEWLLSEELYDKNKGQPGGKDAETDF